MCVDRIILSIHSKLSLKFKLRHIAALICIKTYNQEERYK